MLFLSVLFLYVLFHYFICPDLCFSIKTNHDNKYRNNKLDKPLFKLYHIYVIFFSTIWFVRQRVIQFLSYNRWLRESDLNFESDYDYRIGF